MLFWKIVPASLIFIVFFLIVMIVYFLLPGRFQWIFLLIMGGVFWGNENAVINNVTVEYNEPYQYCDFELYKRDILKDIG